MDNKVFKSCAETGSGDTANKHPDLSPIEDGSVPIDSNPEQKSMPKSERTDNGWKISFE